jgi:ribosomal protein L11 methylase PrmA
MSKIIQSYKDPDGFVFSYENKIFRCIKSNSYDEYLKIFQSDFFKKLLFEKKINNFKLIKNNFHKIYKDISEKDKIVIHRKIDFYSNPFDWSFDQLKDAAQFHLDLEIDLLSNGYCLKDASAKNIIFYKNRPVFIDILSLKKYEDGNYWLGQMQFYQEFLNPLILKSYLSVDYNNWYKENFYGIFTKDLNRLLNIFHKFKPSIFLHVTLPSFLKNKAILNKKLAPQKNFSKEKYIYILRSLKKIIKNLSIKEKQKGEWSSYDEFLPYDETDFINKKETIRTFLQNPLFKNIIDLGCNDGTFLFLSSNKKNLIGCDIDHECINNCYKKSLGVSSNNVFFVKNLAKEIINNNKLFSRKLDACLSLAIVHHLRVTENIPLEKILNFIFSIADEGIIEFIEKKDEKFQLLLDGKADVYIDYSLKNLISICNQKNFKILSILEIKQNKRFLIHYKLNGKIYN